MPVKRRNSWYCLEIKTPIVPEGTVFITQYHKEFKDAHRRMAIATVGRDNLFLREQIDSNLRVDNIDKIIRSNVSVMLIDKDKLEKRFAELADQWEEETRYSSKMRDIINNPSYVKIKMLGKGVIPMILQRLQRNRNYWFDALKYISATDPTKGRQVDDIDQLADIWIEWGDAYGYCVK
ncbi:hypothetical protein [Chlorobium ferrooxidans]|uniref:hypothetical protein n=1 Tax=Chlorobium ferrooxidans TaxID=84205 RepID=UPI0012EA2979|nr:hypothetical protein [Chlorobium ferrooxidans]